MRTSITDETKMTHILFRAIFDHLKLKEKDIEDLIDAMDLQLGDKQIAVETMKSLTTYMKDK